MPPLVTMNYFWLLFLIPALVLSHAVIPGICDCVEESRVRTIVRCSRVFPDVSSFSKITDHLDIADAHDPAEVVLTAKHFSGILVLSNLESIRIHNTTVTKISDNAFGGMKYLYDLDITDNLFLTDFHSKAVSDMINLHTLTLSGNKRLFTRTTGPILISNSLRELDLSDCGIVELHEDTFTKLPALSYLKIANNKIKYISSGTFSTLFNLESIDLSGNLLSTLPWHMLGNSSGLESLNLSGNPISIVPGDIFADSVEDLVELDLSGTKFTLLSLTPLKSLQKLRLHGSQLTSLEGLSAFPDLRHIDASNTNLMSLSSNVLEGNPLLESIRLSGNTRISLPNVIEGNFTFLYYLDLSRCNLDNLNPTIFANMNEIATLNLSGNAFDDSEVLGNALFPIKRLKVLDLSKNKLNSIGVNDFSGNRGLMTLILSGNPLTSPPSLKNNPAIRRLDLSNCTLSRLHLPAIFRQAPRLSQLSLAGNGLFSLYDETYLNKNEDDSPWILPRNLQVLNLNDNPWSCDPSFTSLLFKLNEKRVYPVYDAPQRTKRTKAFRDVEDEWRQLETKVCDSPRTPEGIFVETMTFPPIIHEAKSSNFILWMSLGILMGILVAFIPIMYRVFKLKMNKLSKSDVLGAIQGSENRKLDSLIEGAQSTGLRRGKDYQRLHEDRSPSQPDTPRIYRPPSGGHFKFPVDQNEEVAK